VFQILLIRSIPLSTANGVYIWSLQRNFYHYIWTGHMFWLAMIIRYVMILGLGACCFFCCFFDYLVPKTSKNKSNKTPGRSPPCCALPGETFQPLHGWRSLQEQSSHAVLVSQPAVPGLHATAAGAAVGGWDQSECEKNMVNHYSYIMDMDS